MFMRNEEQHDAAAIAETIHAAFRDADHSSGTEARIVEALRRAGALTVSLVAIEDETVVGHVAISPVSIGDEEDWFGLGPVSVRPDRQRKGIGSLLVRRALKQIKACGAAGCVVLGDPKFYAKFGFAHDSNATYADVPPPYFQVLSFKSKRPHGVVFYHPAFGE